MTNTELVASIIANAQSIASAIAEAAECEHGSDADYSTDTMVACMVSIIDSTGA